MTSTATLDSTAVLAAARRARAAADAAEAEVLAQALAWAHLHQLRATDEHGVAATWGDSPVPLAGRGAPLISEFCISELAAALGLSTEGGRYLIAHALELHHRLPRLWSRVQAGALPAWRARRVADKTIALTTEAAEFVDRQVSQYAPRIGNAALERLVDEAIAQHMPEAAREMAERAADGRCVRIDHQQVSFAGTSLIQGELDLADALELDRALQAGAEQLRALGSEESLDVRRSRALGHLARGEQPLDLDVPDGPGAPAGRPRQVVLYVHLSQAALSGSGTGRVESPHVLVTAEQVAAWCGAPTSKVTVRPVIDLHESIAGTSYEIPGRIREHVILRDPTCVFPHCSRRSRTADLDHLVPFERGGPTSTTNLAPLCRSHHRLKTFGGWAYTMVEPGSYLWRSPHGYSYLKDHTGTLDLAPRGEPPGG